MTLEEKAITVHLVDGTVTGIRTAEIGNRSIKAFACPKHRVKEINSYDKAKSPCLYFLFGEDVTGKTEYAYIGISENFLTRLPDHLNKKDYWHEVIIFVSSNETVTRDYFKYLESLIIPIAQDVERYEIKNEYDSNAPHIPDHGKGTMKSFLEDIKILLGVFGHKVLVEKLPSAFENSTLLSSSTLPSDNQNELELNLSVAGVKLKANAIQTDEGIVVLKDSEAAKETNVKLQSGYTRLRIQLIENKTLVLKENKYIFQKNTLFKSASSAASIVLGRNGNGLEIWKDKSGKTLKEIEQEDPV